MNLGINLCVRCETRWIENKDTRLCASCSHDDRKAAKVKPKVVKPINKISEKRAGQRQEYLKLRAEYMALYPVCEVNECHEKSVDLHHQRGCEGERLLDTNFFMAVCRDHHTYYTDHSKEAIEKGISISRNAKN